MPDFISRTTRIIPDDVGAGLVSRDLEARMIRVDCDVLCSSSGEELYADGADGDGCL